MGLFDRFPYTNPYQLNLDWIIAQMRKFEADYNQLDPDSFLRKSGGLVDGVLQMADNGGIDMNGKPLIGLKTAVNSGDALPFGQAEGRYLRKTGGKMSGALDMDGNNITGLGAPVDDSDAATKLYVDLKIGTPEEPGAYLPLAGGMMSGDINMAGHILTGIRNPVNSTDGVNMAYLEGVNDAIRQWATQEFAKKELIADVLNIASEAELDTQLTGVLSGMQDKTVKFVVFSSSNSAVLDGSAVLATIYRSSAQYATASFISYGWVGNTRWEKTLRGGVWLPLEWDNPPMLLGVEYRTTERYNSYPVYAKAITISGIGVGKTIYNNLINPVTKIVYSEFSVDSAGKNSIYKNEAFTYQVDNMGATHALSVETNTQLSGVSGVLTVKYIKD